MSAHVSFPLGIHPVGQVFSIGDLFDKNVADARTALAAAFLGGARGLDFELRDFTPELAQQIVDAVAADDAIFTSPPRFDHSGAALINRDGKLAMADPDSVPAGRYGKAALEKLGVWGGVAARVARVSLSELSSMKSCTTPS